MSTQAMAVEPQTTIDPAPTLDESEQRPLNRVNPRDASERYGVLPDWVMQHTGLTPAAKLVYAALRMFAGTNGFTWVGVLKLTATLGLGKSTTLRCLKQLVDARVIEREERHFGSNLTHFLSRPSDPEHVDGVKMEPSAKIDGVILRPAGCQNETTMVSKWDSKKEKEKPKEQVLQNEQAALNDVTALEKPDAVTAGQNGSCAPPPENQEKQTPQQPDSSAPEESVRYMGETMTFGQVVEMYIREFPKITDPDGTRAILFKFVSEATTDQMALCLLHTKAYAQAVAPLRDIPEAWVYVFGSFQWFKQRRWERDSISYARSWAEAQAMAYGKKYQ